LSSDFSDSFKGKTFLVTGGAGFIGSHITEALLDLDAKVLVLDDFSNGKKENLASIKKEKDDGRDNLIVISGDIRSFDLESIEELDGIFNEAARALIPSFQDPLTDLDVNTGGTLRILEYARRRRSSRNKRDKEGVKIVHASSGSVYGNPIRIPITEDHPLNPISPYAASKLASEIYCQMYHREFGIDVCMLRYFNVYGPRQSVSEEMGVIPIFVKRALAKEPMTIFGNGMQTRDFLNVKDVVRANLLAFKSERASGQFMNIGGGGHEISILELAYLVMDLCDFKCEPIFKEAKPGDIRRLVADNSKAKELIGYVPQVSLKDGLNQYIEYARKKIQGPN
jgi:UDP-glucose 4-epimerase